MATAEQENCDRQLQPMPRGRAAGDCHARAPRVEAEEGAEKVLQKTIVAVEEKSKGRALGDSSNSNSKSSSSSSNKKKIRLASEFSAVGISHGGGGSFVTGVSASEGLRSPPRARRPSLDALWTKPKAADSGVALQENAQDAEAAEKPRRSAVLRRRDEYEAALRRQAAAEEEKRKDADAGALLDGDEGSGRGCCRRGAVSARMEGLISATQEALERAQDDPRRMEAALATLRGDKESSREEEEEEEGKEEGSCRRVSGKEGEGAASASSVNLAGLRALQRMAPEQRNAAFRELAEAVRGNTSVTDLNLSRIGATDVLAEALADALSDNSTLTSLNLETNDITGKGVEALAAMLGRNTSLRRLRLVNQLRAVCTPAQHALAAAVASNGLLVVCSLDCCDATAREGLGRAVTRNTDALRLERNRRRRQEGLQQQQQQEQEQQQEEPKVQQQAEAATEAKESVAI